MTVFYLDSSALVKNYIPERGTEVLEALFERSQNHESFAASILTFVEANATFRRLLKGGSITSTFTRNVILQLDYDFRSFSYSLPVNDEIIASSLRVVATHALRAGDAILLASVLEVQALCRATDQPLIVLSSDKELLAACQAEGIRTLNPEDSDAMDSLLSLRTSADS